MNGNAFRGGAMAPRPAMPGAPGSLADLGRFSQFPGQGMAMGGAAPPPFAGQFPGQAAPPPFVGTPPAPAVPAPSPYNAFPTADARQTGLVGSPLGVVGSPLGVDPRLAMAGAFARRSAFGMPGVGMAPTPSGMIAPGQSGSAPYSGGYGPPF